MITMPNDYITKKDLDRSLDRIIAQFFDYIKVVNEGMEERFNQKLLETKTTLKKEINDVRKDLQNYQENTSRTLDELKSTTQELKTMTQEIKATNEELKDMNKNILGLISYQESRLRIVEKKAHTHSTDML